jgi:aldose 1-epimerase
MNPPPSGQQYPIASGDQAATIVEVGGSIREYRVGDRPVLDRYDVSAMCDGAHGTPLVPWPNRLADGRYRFDGTDYQVAITEPAKHNAIHGFLRWAPWTAARHEADRVTMAATVFPRSGYPFRLEVEVDYRLTPAGLEVTTTARNGADAALPYGCGQHPYLSAGGGLVDGCDLELGGSTRILTDGERQLPTGTEPVEGTPYDFRSRRRIGELECDYAFTDLTRDGEGRAWVRLWRPEGDCAELWVHGGYPYLEIFTGDTLAPDRRRRGLACEPMSCPPNAFQTGQDLIRLEPGAAVTHRWGARLAAG